MEGGGASLMVELGGGDLTDGEEEQVPNCRSRPGAKEGWFTPGPCRDAPCRSMHTDHDCCPRPMLGLHQAVQPVKGVS
jgi:hypothetical protein